MSEYRKTSFKQGIKAGTRKRDEQQLNLRKDKREKKLARQRCVVKITPEGARGFLVLLSSYNKEELVHSVSLETKTRYLKILDELLSIASDDEIEQHLNTIVDEKVIHFLMNLFTQVENPNLLRLGLSCFVNLTRTVDLKLIRCLFENKFLEHTASHLELLLSGKNIHLNNNLQADIWKVLYNCSVSCAEACLQISSSVLFLQPRLFKIYLEKAAGLDIECLCAIQFFINGMLETHQWDTEGPPLVFIDCVWPFMCHILFDVLQPRDSKQMDASMREMASALFRCFSIVLYRMPAREEEQSMRLIAIGGYGRFMHRLGELFGHYSLVDKRRIARIFASMSAMKFKSEDSTRAYELAQFIPFVFHLLNHTDETLRLEGYKMAGNCMADGVEQIQQFLSLGFMKELITTIRHDQVNVLQQAVFAVMTLFLVCDDEWRNSMSTQAAAANSIMHELVERHRLFRLVMPLLGGQGLDGMTLDILTLIETALKWNRQVCLAHIENADGQNKVDLLLDTVQHLKGNQSTVIYNAAVRVDDLLNGKDSDGSVLMMEDDNVESLAPGVFRGGFTF